MLFRATLLVFCSLAGASALAIAGCGPLADSPTEAGGDAGTSQVNTTAASGLPCAVDEALAKNCRSCHGAVPQFGAPMSLVTYADLTAPAKSNPDKRVFEIAYNRTHSTANPMPPPPNARLGQSEQGALDAWIQSGAKNASEVCNTSTPPPSTGISKGLSCTPDQKIRPPTKFVMDKNKSDEIVCYGFEVTNAQKRHVIGLGPHLDNTRIVHHMILFESTVAASPTPAPCGGGSAANWRFIGGWAPGGGAYDLPPEAGFPQEGTTHYVMQVHYNNQAGLENQSDESGFDLCTTTELRANDADVMASGTLSINLPPRTSTNTTCNFTWPTSKIHVFGASPHMHRLGQSLSITKVKGGVASSILDRPNFSFDIGGGSDPVDMDLEKGDVIRTSCGWKNTSDAKVGFGEATSDEMCFGFMMYYPRITSSLWKFPVPAALGTCSSQNGGL